jgi:hypothetical protein
MDDFKWAVNIHSEGNVTCCVDIYFGHPNPEGPFSHFSICDEGLDIQVCYVYMCHVSFHERIEMRDIIGGHQGNREGPNPLWARNARPVSVHHATSCGKSEGSIEHGIEAGSVLRPDQYRYCWHCCMSTCSCHVVDWLAFLLVIEEYHKVGHDNFLPCPTIWYSTVCAAESTVNYTINEVKLILESLNFSRTFTLIVLQMRLNEG